MQLCHGRSRAYWPFAACANRAPRSRYNRGPKRPSHAMAKSEEPQRLIAENRKARFDYFIEERYEAGIALQGWEVKAMRAGRAQLKEAYVFVRGFEAFLFGAHISPLNSASSHVVADPVRTRNICIAAIVVRNSRSCMRTR